MSNNLTVLKQNIVSNGAATQFKMALPAHISPEKFQRAAITAINNFPDIADCSQASVLNALIRCAQDGLLPDGREAAIVKFAGNAQYLPMVYGLIKRMRNSGDVKSVNAYIVYENDVFEYEIRDGSEQILHRPLLSGPRGEMILAYAVITLKDDAKHIEVMMKADIEKARCSSKTQKDPSKPTGVWAQWYEEMAKKTVLHRAAKRCPMSADVEDFMRGDMKVMLNEPALVEHTGTEKQVGYSEALDLQAEPEAIDVDPTTQEGPAL